MLQRPEGGLTCLGTDLLPAIAHMLTQWQHSEAVALQASAAVGDLDLQEIDDLEEELARLDQHSSTQAAYSPPAKGSARPGF